MKPYSTEFLVNDAFNSSKVVSPPLVANVEHDNEALLESAQSTATALYKVTSVEILPLAPSPILASKYAAASVLIGSTRYRLLLSANAMVMDSSVCGITSTPAFV